MPVQTLTQTDAFVVRDLEGVPAAGLARSARKILTSSASDMARSASYTFGLYGIQRSGASAGLNYEGDDLEAELRKFAEELAPLQESGDLSLYAAKGIRGDLIGELAGYRHSDFSRYSCVTAVAAAAWLFDGKLAGKRIAIEGDPPELLSELLTEAQAEIVDVPGVDKKPWMVWGADVDLLLAGSKVGALTHQGAEFVKAPNVVCWGPTAVTTKAFAILDRRGVRIVPGFLAGAGGLLLGDVHKDSMADRVNVALEDSAAEDESLFIGACKVAEKFLASWNDTKLFGRPLA